MQCSLPSALPTERELGITYSVVELYNLWYSFSRCLYLSTALGARDSTGSRVVLVNVTRPTSVEDALTLAIRTRQGQQNRRPPWTWRDEPSWAQTRVLLQGLSAIGASNQQQVSNGLSTPTSVFDELPHFRYFFAHRGRETLQRLRPLIRAHSIPSNLRPTDALLTPATVLGTMRTQPLVLDWIDEVSNSITFVI